MSGVSPAFDAWLDAFFASYYRHRPVNATFIGVHDYDDRLPDHSERGRADLLADLAGLRERLRGLPDEPLDPARAMDRDLAAGFLAIEEWEQRSGHFERGNPSNAVGEAAFGVISLFLRPFAPLGQRVEAAIGRLEGIPGLLASARNAVRVAPPAWTERAMRECDGTLALLTGGIDRLIHDEGIAEPRAGRLRRAAATAARAVGDHRQHLATDLLHRPSEEYAAGPEALDLLLRRAHFIDQPADELERFAAEQLDASLAALSAGATDLGYTGWGDALAVLADTHPTAGCYEQRYGEVWEQARAAAVAHDLLTWPDFPIRYVPRPIWARAAAPSLYFLFYRAPAAFDRVEVVDYLIEPLERDWPAERQEELLRATNDSVIKLNHVLHHGGIGHHVQNWHAARATSRVGRVAAVDCASRTAMPCGGTMAEGWACYATDLMGEVGFLTPLERLSQVHGRARMAARALVDLRLHGGSLSLDDAARFYEESVQMPAPAARAEAVKNSMFPGMALIYLFGNDQIRALRHEIAAMEGDRFSLRRFHDRFLAFGSLPVALIADAMRREARADAPPA